MAPHKFVLIVNACFKKLISWLMGQKMHIVMDNFKQWHMLPKIQGTIDYAHILGCKPFILFPNDLIYFHNYGRCFIIVCVMVDDNNKFLDILIGLLKNVIEFYIGLD
jgi:hypothetical protein